MSSPVGVGATDAKDHNSFDRLSSAVVLVDGSAAHLGSEDKAPLAETIDFKASGAILSPDFSIDVAAAVHTAAHHSREIHDSPAALKALNTLTNRLMSMRAKVASANVPEASSASNCIDTRSQSATAGIHTFHPESLEVVPPVTNIYTGSSPDSEPQPDRAHADTSDERDACKASHPAVSAGEATFETKSAKIHVPMRHARAAVLCSSASDSDSVLRNTFWTLLTGEMPSAALVHTFRCIIEPEISGRKNVWVKALDADPLCYLSLIFSRVNVPPVTFFSIMNANSQPHFIDSVYLSSTALFILPFDLDPFLGIVAVDHDAVDASAAVLNSLASLLQRIATLCVRYAANGEFIGPSVILAGVCSKEVKGCDVPILQLVSDTIFDMIKGSFISSGLIECMLDASSCLWFYPVSASSSRGISAVQDALCAFFHGPLNKTFTVPQHWFHLITTLRQNSQPAVRMSSVAALAAECFALDVPSHDFLSELERFISYFADQGVAWRSSTERELYVVDGPLLSWQFAAAVLHHDGSVRHGSRHLQSTSRRSHQQAYHSFISTGQLTFALMKTFASSEALACHELPVLVASGIAVPLSADVFAMLPMMPGVICEDLQPLSATSCTPCLSLICFMFTCDVPSRLLNPAGLNPPSAFAHRASPLYLIPQLWAALRAMVVDELQVGSESIVMSSAVFACTATAHFTIEHDVRNQVLRLRLRGDARDMLLSRILCCFSRAITIFPFISHSFALESSQFPSCASSPPALFSLRSLLLRAASGDTFHHQRTKIEAHEVVSVMGSSGRDAPWVSVCVLYSPSSLPFARAVCDTLSLSRAAERAVHCCMLRSTPFMQQDAELNSILNQADHTIVIAEKHELVDALHSQPHSLLASQLSQFHQLLTKFPNHSFSSVIVDGDCNLLPHIHPSNFDVAGELQSSPISSSSAVSGVHDMVTKIFLGSERLPLELSAELSAAHSTSALSPAQAVSSAVLQRLNALLTPRLEDANVFQTEFSPVTLATDSALHQSASIELEVSAQSWASATVAHPEQHASADANSDDSPRESISHDDGYRRDDEYDSGDRDDIDVSGSEAHGSELPPRPPTPPADDEVMELQSLILTLSISPPANAQDDTVDAATPDSPSASLLVQEAAVHAEPHAAEREVRRVRAASRKQAAPRKAAAKLSVVVGDAAEGSSRSAKVSKAFLKKGTNSLRLQQRQSTIAKRLQEGEALPAVSPHSSSNLSLPQSSLSPVRYRPSSKNYPRFHASSPEPEQSSRQLARSPVVMPRLPYPPSAHPRLLLLLPELCFDRSPSAAQRLVSSWLDDSARSKSMRLVCLCEMHVARPHGPSSSPLILWHRCSHQGFPVAAGKVPDAIRSCAETSREVLTMSRLAGVSSRIFGSLQHEELLQRNMAEWNHANLRMVQDVDGLQAMAAASPAVNPSTGPQSSGSLQPGGAASPYLSDVPSGIDPHDIARFAPSFSRDHTQLQFMRIANHGINMFHGDMWLCPDHYELVDMYQNGQMSTQMLVASALSVEISKLPPFESSPFPRTASHRGHQPHSPLPWAHSSIISSIAASLSAPLQSADNPSSPHAPPPGRAPAPALGNHSEPRG